MMLGPEEPALQALTGPAGQSLRMNGSVWWTGFSPDGRLLYSCGNHGDIWCWNLATFALEWRLETGLDYLSDADLHRNGRWLAGGGHEGTVHVWDLSDKTEVLRVKRHRKQVNAVRFTGDGHVFSADVGGKVGLTELATGKRNGNLIDLKATVHELAVAESGPLVGALTYKGLRVWNRETKTELNVEGYYTHGGAGQAALSLPGQGERVWVAFRTEPQLRVWDFPEPEPVWTADLGGPAFELTWSQGHECLAVGLFDKIVLLDPARQAILARWPAPNGSQSIRGPIDGLAFSPDGSLLASGDAAGGIWLWPVQDWLKKLKPSSKPTSRNSSN